MGFQPTKKDIEEQYNDYLEDKAEAKAELDKLVAEELACTDIDNDDWYLLTEDWEFPHHPMPEDS